jgi:hypothetical protein
LALLLQKLVVIGTLAQQLGAALGAVLILAGDAIAMRAAIVTLWADTGAAGAHIVSLLLGHVGTSASLFPINPLRIIRGGESGCIDKSRFGACWLTGIGRAGFRPTGKGIWTVINASGQQSVAKCPSPMPARIQSTTQRLI